MVAIFDELLADLEPGKSSRDGDWSFVPLRTKKPSGLDYLTLFEAVESGLASVSEVNPQGSVSDMKVTNDGSLPVFIPDGMTLLGCRQNRLVNISVLVPPKSVTIIPVSCVEQGRWHAESVTSSPSEVCDPVLRSAMCEQTSDGLRNGGSARAVQGSVWGHVDQMLGTTRTFSPTAAYNALYAAVPTAHPRREIPCPDGANGIVTIRGRRICSLDLFDKPATLNKLWPRIMRGTIVPLEQPESPPMQAEDIRRFLADCLSKPQGDFAPVGLGSHHRFANDRSVGSALVVDGQVLHLSAFHKNGAPPPTTADDRPRPQPRRQWWRFWY